MRTKLMKTAAIGLFVVAMLFNISVYFDTNNSQNADLSLGSLKVSLFQKAYACGPGSGDYNYELVFQVLHNMDHCEGSGNDCTHKSGYVCR